MNEATTRLVLAWMAKAESDLLTASLLIEQEKRLLDIAVYHCQQTAEKALKAWLTLREIVFPKTHDLEALLRLGLGSAPEFAEDSEHARLLTPFAVEFRYPGGADEPPTERAEQALAMARELYTTCKQVIASRLDVSKSRPD